MSAINEKSSISHDLEKVDTVNQLDEVVVNSEPLSAEEDRRILRKIDMKYVEFRALSKKLTKIVYFQLWRYPTSSNS